MIDLKEASVKAPLFFGVIEPVQSVRSRACVGTVTFCGILFSKKLISEVVNSCLSEFHTVETREP